WDRCIVLRAIGVLLPAWAGSIGARHACAARGAGVGGVARGDVNRNAGRERRATEAPRGRGGGTRRTACRRRSRPAAGGRSQAPEPSPPRRLAPLSRRASAPQGLVPRRRRAPPPERGRAPAPSARPAGRRSVGP